MKSLIKNTDAVSYLLLVGLGLSIVVSGIAFNFISDFVDTCISFSNTVWSGNLQAQMDADSINTGNFLLMAFKFCLIPILFVLMYFQYSMAQKPVRPW